jgi:hypothetical protein
MIAHWFEDFVEDVCACCGPRGTTPEELAARLGVSTATAVSLIVLLASEGRIRIDRVSLPTANGRAEPVRRAA